MWFVYTKHSLLAIASLTKPRLEYEKLHRALKKSHDQEKRLIKKCRELNGEIVNNAAKVQTALKLSQEDQATIGSLRKEIEKAWTMVDVAHEKEGTYVGGGSVVDVDTTTEVLTPAKKERPRQRPIQQYMLKWPCFIRG